MQMFRRAGIAIVVALAIAAGCTSGDKMNPVTQAPDFSLQDLSGQHVRLADLKGKVVLVEFWATWCPPCRESIPVIERLHKTYGGKGLVTLGVSLDDGGWEEVQSFASAHGITYRVLKGDDRVSASYMVRVIPMAVLVNKDGLIARQYLGGGDESGMERDIRALL